MPLLTVERLTARYGAVTALHGVSLHVGEGEIVTLIGANGAGKSTLLRALSGLLPDVAGEIRFGGQEITRLRPQAIVGLGLVHCPEGRQVFARMTVQENLTLGAFSRRRTSPNPYDQLDRVFGLFPRLRERRTQLAGTLSGGEQQMLAIGRALMARPRLLMLDEPSLGVAPLLTRAILAAIQELNRQGTTVLLVEQNANLALRVAHRAYALELGRIVLEGTGAELLENPRVRQAYLGEEMDAG